MGVYEEKSQVGVVMHWQCERVAGDNNNRLVRECGGCTGGGGEAHGEPCPKCSRRDACDCRTGGLQPFGGCGRDDCDCRGPGLPPCGGCEPRDQAEQCAGCGRPILDRFILQAVERRWHAPCLRCYECQLPLDSELTCFARDGNIFCKKDYYKLFGPKRCAGCQANIFSSELVMRAREHVYHVHCFCCALCHTPLTKGDTFGMIDSTIYCRLHFEAMNECARVPQAPPEMMQPPFFNGAATPTPTPVPAPGAPRQKGRPRKRKPKDLEAMAANLDLNTEYLDMGFSRSGSGMGGSSRTKRMRTSFKHHQLRTMKSYFAINHNPDAKDLKQLSQKTGLPKRVLQVWFQNARAKWRRMITKQEGKMSSEKMSPDGSMELEGLYGPGSGGGSCLRLTPLSPQSLDCP